MVTKPIKPTLHSSDNILRKSIPNTRMLAEVERHLNFCVVENPDTKIKEAEPLKFNTQRLNRALSLITKSGVTQEELQPLKPLAMRAILCAVKERDLTLIIETVQVFGISMAEAVTSTALNPHRITPLVFEALKAGQLFLADETSQLLLIHFEKLYGNSFDVKLTQAEASRIEMYRESNLHLELENPLKENSLTEREKDVLRVEMYRELGTPLTISEVVTRAGELVLNNPELTTSAVQKFLKRANTAPIENKVIESIEILEASGKLLSSEKLILKMLKAFYVSADKEHEIRQKLADAKEERERALEIFSRMDI
jgi:hypothetical protein